MIPEISVVMPAYNAEGSISESIMSVCNQSFTDIEILVVDDGSTDSTLKAIATFKDPRIHIISLSRNLGVAKARNKGISKSKGKYIAFIDADDIWIKNKLERQWQVLQSTPEAALAYSWNDYINDSGNYLHPGQRIQLCGDVFHLLVTNNFLENGSTPLVRKTAIQRVGGFDSTLTPSEDWDFYLRIAKHYSFVCVPEVHVLYRKSINSSSSNIKEMEDKSLQVIKKTFQQSPEIPYHLKEKSVTNLHTWLLFKCLDSKMEQMAASFLQKVIGKRHTLSKKMLVIITVKIVKGTISSFLYHNILRRK